MGKRTVAVRLLNISGRSDALAELEVGFLHQLLPLFQVGDGTPRADGETVRVGTKARLLNYLFYRDVDLIHIASHGAKSWMQVGDRESFRPSDLTRHARDAGHGIGAVILNTSCEMADARWVKAFLDAGAVAYMAAKRVVMAKDAAIFAAAFYSAYFGTIHRQKTDIQRAFDAYRLAHAAYCSFVPNASRSRFYFQPQAGVSGRVNLARIELE